MKITETLLKQMGFESISNNIPSYEIKIGGFKHNILKRESGDQVWGLYTYCGDNFIKKNSVTYYNAHLVTHTEEIIRFITEDGIQIGKEEKKKEIKNFVSEFI